MANLSSNNSSRLAYDYTAERTQTPDEQDLALVALLVAGDEQALEVLYRRYARPVFSLALPAAGGQNIFGITIEPAGGSAQPTSTPILLGEQLAASS